ncbi:TPA: tetratricopeptide repeat protein [Vibrio cholerae]|uniref:tetratricopeptide repeat protein n=1 Tax=Vibrio cholerae TaxID=666 RepID=UPI001A324980|nr:sel1 repeat family protein [Vibrio cholerae]EGR4089286.1 sel1 repeat family protein [Vibrio cholerae]EGR4167633.1 sel1 repeat family protein [Vibrio cholerae]EKF9405828.1 sel1 repeat family protein [Vibrio cholerae]EKG1749002.1 sel1 repeat family protein [Vibrio cholerae]
MNIIGIAIGATGLTLILIFVWMIVLSVRRKRLEEERRAREEAYRKALERNREQERKERLFKAESGHIPTILFLAKEAERNSLKEALFWYEKAAHLDNIPAMYGIVRVCQRIREDVIAKEKAKFWQTCVRGVEGDLAAKFETGMAWLYGRGVEVNVSRGIGLIQEAAEANLIDAILFMGGWCVSKDNIAPTPSDSTFWYEKAARMGSAEGMMRLGQNLLHGIGGASDFPMACYWLERASEKGHPEAMYHAGEAWIDRGAHGKAIAYIWLFLSASMGYEPAKNLRDLVGGKLGVESIVGLQALAKPLQRKLATSSVTKHSMIRALNKLYKRQIPIPTKDVVDPLAEQEAESLIDLIEPNALNDLPHVASERLDFSQGPIDSLPFDKR